MIKKINNIDYKNNVSSVIKGSQYEISLILLLKTQFSDFDIIDNSHKSLQMDILMTHKIKKYSLLIECKNSQLITRKALAKFIRDKNINNYAGYILLSNKSSIPNYVDNKNEYKLVNCNELYIYSDDKKYIIDKIEFFTKILENNNIINNFNIRKFETSIDLYIENKNNLINNDIYYYNLSHKYFPTKLRGWTFNVPKTNIRRLHNIKNYDKYIFANKKKKKSVVDLFKQK
jgi:hypothetical protein